MLKYYTVIKEKAKIDERNPTKATNAPLLKRISSSGVRKDEKISRIDCSIGKVVDIMVNMCPIQIFFSFSIDKLSSSIYI